MMGPGPGLRPIRQAGGRVAITVHYDPACPDVTAGGPAPGTHAAMSQPTVDLKNRYLAALLAWMVPGLGHWYQGRKFKAVLYGVGILSLFFAGMVLGDWKVVYWRWVNPLRDSEHFCINYPGQFFAGLAAFPALLQATLKHYGMNPTLWGYLAEPSQNEINGLYPRLGGKFVEMGYLYTTIAGLLNILAIFDAAEGPANQGEPESAATAKADPAPVPGVAS